MVVTYDQQGHVLGPWSFTMGQDNDAITAQLLSVGILLQPGASVTPSYHPESSDVIGLPPYEEVVGIQKYAILNSPRNTGDVLNYSAASAGLYWGQVTAGASAGVSSFNDRRGVVVPQAGDYSVGMVTGAAPLNGASLTNASLTTPVIIGPLNGASLTNASLTNANLASPVITGSPTAPTPGVSDNSALLATTAFVQNVVDGITGASAGVRSWNSRTGAVVPVDGDYSYDMVTGAAPLDGGTFTNASLTSPVLTTPVLTSPVLTGTPVAPTAASTTSTTQIATTEFVQDLVSNSGVQSWNSRSGSVTPQAGDYTVSEVTGAAPLASPAFTGTPTAPNPASGASTTQLATTAWVASGYAPASVLPTYATAASVASTYAPLASPALTGTPTVPTPAIGASTTQIANTEWVTEAIGTETSRAEGAEALLAPIDSPTFTGTPTGPNPASGASTTQLATTAWVAEGYVTASTLAAYPTAASVASTLASYLTTSAASTVYAPIINPSLQGVPTAPTAASTSNNTQIATTAFVQDLVENSVGVSSLSVEAGSTITLSASTGAIVIGGGGASTGGSVLTGQSFTTAGFTVPDPITSGQKYITGLATGDCAFTFPPTAGNAGLAKEFYIIHQQPQSGGPYTPTFPANVNWAGNANPIFSGNGYADRLHFLSVDQYGWMGEITPGFPVDFAAMQAPFQTVNSTNTSLVVSGNTATVPRNNASVGDIVCMSVACYSTRTLVSVSGGGVTTWSTPVNASVGILSLGFSWGIVTSTGPSSATLTMTGSASGTEGAVGHSEFAPLNPLPGFVISADGPAVSNSASAVNSIVIPTLTPSTTGELCFVACYMAGGSPLDLSGYTQGVGNQQFYNTNVSSTQSSLTITQGSTGNALAVAQLFKL